MSKSQINANPSVFVISVKSGYEERQEFMNKQLQSLGIDFEYMLKFDIGDDGCEAIRDQYFGHVGEKISPYQSLFLKHVEILRNIKLHKIPLSIIFEDDAILSPNFIEIINYALNEYQQINYPSVISLGHGNNIFTPRKQIKNGQYLYNGFKMRCCDSYVLRYQEATMILDYIEDKLNKSEKVDWAIDFFYDIVFKEIDIKFLWLEPSIVTQGSMCGMFTSELDAKRSKRNLFANKVHYLYNNISKKIASYFK